jgi:hypothetical protein
LYGWCGELGVGDGGEGAEVGVEDDVLEEGQGGVFAAGRVLLRIRGSGGGGRVGDGEALGDAGDAQSAEEQGGAAVVEGVGGDAGEHLLEGAEDGGRVFEQREGEDGVVGMDAEVFGRAAGGVVVVAERLAAQGWAAAAVAGGLDVAAELVVAWRLAAARGGEGFETGAGVGSEEREDGFGRLRHGIFSCMGLIG